MKGSAGRRSSYVGKDMVLEELVSFFYMLDWFVGITADLVSLSFLTSLSLAGVRPIILNLHSLQALVSFCKVIISQLFILAGVILIRLQSIWLQVNTHEGSSCRGLRFKTFTKLFFEITYSVDSR